MWWPLPNVNISLLLSLWPDCGGKYLTEQMAEVDVQKLIHPMDKFQDINPNRKPYIPKQSN
jgi:hypothetical protein